MKSSGWSGLLQLSIGFRRGRVMPWRGLMAVFLAVLGTMPVAGAGAAKNGNYFAILSATPGAEMPRRAGELVLQAGAAALAPTTVEVVKAAVGVNPAAVLAVVGCVAETAPAMAATGAGTAAALEPHLAVAIARAAVSVAPGEAGAIVEAVCRVVPADFEAVALAAVREAPGSDRAVLAGVAAGMPELKREISAQLAGYDGKEPSTGLMLAAVAKSARVASLVTPVGKLGREGGNRRSLVTMPELDGITGVGGGLGQDGITQPRNVAMP